MAVCGKLCRCDATRRALSATARVAALALLLLGTVSVTAASATTIGTFALGNTLDMGPGPYATLDVTLTSGTTADFDITTFDPYLLVAGSSFAFNTTDDISFSDLVSTPGTNPIAQAGNNQNVSSWGVFKYVFDAQNAAAGNTEFTFTATLLGGGTWANELDIFDANNKGNIAAVHAMYPPNCEVGACTGFATFGSPNTPQNPAVPEPASLLLLGTGLTVVARRVRRQKRAGSNT